MRTIIILLIAGITAACTSEPKYEIVLTNTLDRTVKDAAVVVPRTALEAIPQLEEGLQPVLTNNNGKNIPLQADDLDGDGIWDELFIVTDLEGGEEMNAALAFRSPDKLPELKARTNLRFAKKDEEYREVTTAVREQHAVNTKTQQVWQMEGMGLMVSTEDFAAISEAPESGNGIVDTYCIHMKAAAGKPVKFRFYTVWEREDERWESAADFERLLREEAKRMVAPVTWSLVKR